MELNYTRIANDCGSWFDAVERQADGSVRLIKYNTPTSGENLVDFAPTKNWRGDFTGDYSLRVNIPPQRVLAKVALVVRTSANNYTVAVSNANTTITNCKTLDEVVEAIRGPQPNLLEKSPNK